MALPIPSILDHSLAGVDFETRTTFALFEGLVARLESSLKREIRFKTDGVLEFPPIVVSYLLGSLQRMRVTSWGVITTLNAPNEILYVTAVRSMIESTANLCYVRLSLEKTYAGELPRTEMAYLALRMRFATRKPDDMKMTSEEATRVSSVNVLTSIKALDRYAASECGFANQRSITSWYERLCEFCHPNSLGNSVGSALTYDEGRETFEIEPVVRSAVLVQFANYTFFALYAFCRIYNDIWNLLTDAGETLPVWDPPSDPTIRLD